MNYQRIIILAVGVICFFAGIAYVNNWLVLHKNYPEIGMFDVPFDSNVWGTVSDWVMIIVTSFTALYLVKTFSEQKRANDLLYAQHRRKIMPKFQLDSRDIPTIIENQHLTLTLLDNELRNLQVNHFSVDFQNIPTNIPLDVFPNNSITLVVGTISPFFIGQVLTVEISFEDSEGNKYVQRLFKRSFSSLSLTTPIYIPRSE